MLTTPLMQWFWDHYADPADRTDPPAAPLRGDLSRPPAGLHRHRATSTRSATRASPTPMRWQAAGVPVRHIRARGHTHTSLTMVDVVISGAPVRAEMADALTAFFPVTAHG